jgi:hypothetical protein
MRFAILLLFHAQLTSVTVTAAAQRTHYHAGGGILYFAVFRKSQGFDPRKSHAGHDPGGDGLKFLTR